MIDLRLKRVTKRSNRGVKVISADHNLKVLCADEAHRETFPFVLQYRTLKGSYHGGELQTWSEWQDVRIEE